MRIQRHQILVRTVDHNAREFCCRGASDVCTSSMSCAGYALVTMPCTNVGVAQFLHQSSCTDHSAACTIVDANEPNNVHVAIGLDRRPIPADAFSLDSQQVLHKENTEDQNKFFALPDSLAKNFDPSELNKIANAIVRVKTYGLSSMTHKSGFSLPSFEHTSPRVLPSVGAFTVQCAKCFKWRLIPSKEEYEQIRQDILEKPFFCISWKPGASCDDPPELDEDSGLLWAIDKPNIPCPPRGWERRLVIRGEGCFKFSDIYYVSPFGKRLRSMPEIERYLSENPKLVEEGARLSQFSFTSAKALDSSYCKKRSREMRGSISRGMIPTSIARVPEGCQSQGEQLSTCFSRNAALNVEPLRAWVPSVNSSMICHQAGDVEASGSAW